MGNVLYLCKWPTLLWLQPAVFQAQPTDYLSRVAWLAGIPLKQFMLDNVGNVKNLDSPLAGIRLLLCKPAQGGFQCFSSACLFVLVLSVDSRHVYSELADGTALVQPRVLMNDSYRQHLMLN